MQISTSTRSVAGLSAAFGGALFAVSGALQATGLDWAENAVRTPAQHVTMALVAAALVAVVPAAAALSRYASQRLRIAWIGIAAGQAVVAAASTVSNVRGVDADWFPAVAVAANLAWIVGTIALAVGLYRARRVPRALAAGIVVAYIGSIPLATHGGGILTGCFWLAVGYLFSLGSVERRTLQPAAS